MLLITIAALSSSMAKFWDLRACPNKREHHPPPYLDGADADLLPAIRGGEAQSPSFATPCAQDAALNFGAQSYQTAELLEVP